MMEASLSPARDIPNRRWSARPLSVFWFLFRRAWVSAYKNNCLGTAKGAAYSALLGFFPMLTSVAAILVQANGEAIARSLARLLNEAVPPGAEALVVSRLIVRGERPISLLFLATILSLWAASGLMITLMQGFERTYQITATRSFVKQRLVAILLVIATLIPVIMASMLLLLGDRAERNLFTMLGMLAQGQQLEGGVRALSFVVRYAVILGALMMATSVLYYFGPYRPRSWRLVWPGAMVCTLLWLITTITFSWYVRNVANYNFMYGGVAVVAALLVWMYLLSIIALYGCEFNAERERLFG